MKRLFRFAAGLVLCGLLVASAQASFTSFYIFGDGVSTTTNNYSSTPNLYYGHRFCNGRVWVEVLAQRQGLNYDSNKNWSYYGDYSSNLVQNVNRFTSPMDSNTSLFTVWVNDADFIYILNTYDPPYTTNGSMAVWTNAINQSLTNHWNAIQTLYAKGVRTLIMPNAVDVSEVPYYSLSSSDKAFIRQRVIDFDTSYVALLNQAQASLPGLVIYLPDFFGLLDNLLAHPAAFGLVNPSIDALEDPSLTNKSLNGPGANYVFWDYLDPTAKANEVMADIVQRLISPSKISNITCLSSSDRLDVSNLPIGLDGFVDSSADLMNWAAGLGITSSNAVQTLFVPNSGPRQFYKLRFPFSWTWP